MNLRGVFLRTLSVDVASSRASLSLAEIRSRMELHLPETSEAETFHAAAETGFRGYVLKPRLCTDFVPAINLALSGNRFVSPGIG